MHFKGTLDYISLRIRKQRKGFKKKKKLLCVVSQNGSQPFLNLGHGHVLPHSIVLNLQKTKAAYQTQMTGLSEVGLPQGLLGNVKRLPFLVSRAVY